MTDNEKKFWDGLKAKHPDALLLFRCGDFYETYNEDAVACASILGITLTMNKDEGSMAGFPHHALDTYLPKLVRAGKRVAICDQLEDPKLRKAVKRGISETINETSETKSEETMAKNLKGADLIGKTIVNEQGTMKYQVKGVAADGETLQVEFIVGGKKPVGMPLPKAQYEKLLAGGWTIGDATTATPKDEVEEVEDVQPQPAKQVKIKEPKAAKPKAEPKDGLKYETYTNKKGKQCARIVGFAEDAPAYQRETAEKLHASASYEKDKKGNRLNYLCFGPRYAAAAKQVCDALNAGKTIAECQAIIDATTEERAQQREEWKQKHAGPTYTAQEVAAIIEDFAAGKALPEDISKHLKKAA